MSIKAHQVLESDFITKNDLSGNASDVLGGDGVVRNATFESLEVLDFIDPLNNSYIHSNWTQDIPSAGPTITEDDSKLLMSVASGSYDWFAGTFTAPNVNTPVEPMDFTAKIHVSGVDTASLNSAGITVHVDGAKGDFYRIDLRGDGSNYDISVGLGPSTDVTTIQNVGQNNAWLALARRGNLVMVAYSLNSVDNEPAFDDMTIADKRDWTFSYTKNLIALVSMSAVTNPGFDTEFRNFSLRYKTALVKSRGYVGQGIDFHDNLNNGIIHNNWIEDIPDVTGTDPTITEDSEKLIFDYVGGQSLDWYSSTYTAPTLNIVLEPLDFVAKVFVDNIPASNSNGSALIHYKIGTKSSYSRLQLNYHGSVYRFHSVVSPSTEVIHDSNVGQDYGWLAIARRGHTILLFSSKNDVDNEPSLNDMTFCKSYNQHFDYNNNYIALGQLCWNLYPATEIHYKKFSLVYNQINLYNSVGYAISCGSDGEYTDLNGALAALDGSSGGTIHLKGSHTLNANKTLTKNIDIIGIGDDATINLSSYTLTFSSQTHLKNINIETTTINKALTVGVSSLIENCVIKTKVILDESIISNCQFETHSYLEIKNSTIKNCVFSNLSSTSGEPRIQIISGNNNSNIEQCSITLPNVANEYAIDHQYGFLNVSGFKLEYPGAISNTNAAILLKASSTLIGLDIELTGSGQIGMSPLRMYTVSNSANILVDGLNLTFPAGLGVKADTIGLEANGPYSNFTLRNTHINRIVVPSNNETPLSSTGYVINSKAGGSGSLVTIEDLIIADLSSWISSPTDATGFGGVIGSNGTGGLSHWSRISLYNVNLDTAVGNDRYLLRLNGGVSVDNLRIGSVQGTAWLYVIYVAGGSNVIKNSYIYTAGAGDWSSDRIVYVPSGSRNIFVNNTLAVAQEAAYGFYISSDDTIFSNNQIYLIAGTGSVVPVYFYDANGGTVIGNMINTSGGNNITYAGTTTNMVPSSGNLSSYNSFK